MSYPQETLSTLCDEVVVGHVGPSSGHRLDDGIPFLMGKNIGEGFLKLADLERVTPAFHRAQKKSQLQPGDIAVVRIGKSGLAAKIPESLGEANCSGLVVIKRPRKVTADYLVHFLNSPEGRRQSLDEAKGSTRQTLNTKSIAAAEIPVPPLAEQRRIAEVLDRAEALRAKRRAALAQLDSLTQSLFLDLFGDPATNPKGWPVRTIAELCEVKGGKRLPKGEEYSLTPTPFRYIRVTNLIDGAVNESALVYLKPEVQAQISRYIVNTGDVIISIAGSIGLIAPVPASLNGANLTENAAKLVPRDRKAYDAGYLASLLRTPVAQNQISSHIGQVTIGKLALFRIEKLTVPLPPITLQREFARRVTAVEALKTAQRASLAELDALFATLQHRAFRGEL